jgi:tetratricopeptide (TPR) repeat protein
MRRWVTLLWLIAGVGLLWEAGGRHQRLIRHRHRPGDPPADALADAPPLLAFTTVALAGFRGMIADLLWIRISTLQQEGKYFEIVQLADWITKLEPQFAAVWGYHAWNLAYNISVMFPDPADRWRWVQHGIHLLRDEGLRYNPGAPRLYWELGWLFQHKLGAAFDTAHPYYQRAWAGEMTAALGGPRPDYDHLRNDEAAGALLRERYKMAPEVMDQVDQAYGPLDWRRPETHAVYWAWRGRPYATGFNRVALDRMITQSLSALFERGQLTVDDATGEHRTSPDWDLLPRALQAAEEAIAAHPDQDSFVTHHQNLLRLAVVMLSRAGRREAAQALFDELARTYPAPETADGLDAFVRSRTEQP